MKIISFDVGIRNLAYCIISVDNNKLIINDWNILNLINSDQSKPIYKTCTCYNKQTRKNQPLKLCGKKAKYIKDDQYYCDKHATLTSEYIIPTKLHTISHLRKLKLNELHNIITTHDELNNNDVIKINRIDIITKINEFYEQTCFKLIPIPKLKSANDIDLIQVGRNLKILLDNVIGIEEITHILIENQLSPIATRMKTIQGMIAQYFIMKNNENHIEFISSVNKLKQFSDTTTKTTYKEHKLDGIQYTIKIINNNECLSMWKDALSIKKKDDLADSFLQGIWYLKRDNIIYYAEDLNIKFV